jgi:hypothetical protein
MCIREDRRVKESKCGRNLMLWFRWKNGKIRPTETIPGMGEGG